MEIQGNKQPPVPTPETTTPANAPARRVTSATRVPMSLPNTKLAVPVIPGYYLYWHLGKNVRQAQRAGYTFVEPDELDIEQTGVANSMEVSGSTDMGTRISVSAGNSLTEENESERLYLMKLPDGWHAEDMAAVAAKNEGIAQALRAGNIGADQDPDRNKRYMKKGQDLFYAKNPGR